MLIVAYGGAHVSAELHCAGFVRGSVEVSGICELHQQELPNQTLHYRPVSQSVSQQIQSKSIFQKWSVRGEAWIPSSFVIGGKNWLMC